MRVFDFLTETVFKLNTPSAERRVFFTAAFKKDYEHFKNYSKADVPKALEEFLEFKKSKGQTPFNGKDSPMMFALRGVWHYHVVHGKVIVLYTVDDSHIELYRMLEHADYDSPKSNSALGRYISNLEVRDFQEMVTADDQPDCDYNFGEIEELIYSLTATKDDRTLLTQFSKGEAGMVQDFILATIDATSLDDAGDFYKAWKSKFGMSIFDYARKALTTTADALTEDVGPNYFYHGCPMEHVLSILRYNELEIGEDYECRGSANSFSREYRLSDEFRYISNFFCANPPNGGIFVIDRDKLAANYKIEPFADLDQTRHDEYEEIIRRNITRFMSYVVSINVDPADIENVFHNTEWCTQVTGDYGFDDAVDVQKEAMRLAAHPLLNRWFPRGAVRWGKPNMSRLATAE